MNQERPLILISNDDGYDIPGINYLADVARQWGDVIVVAPDGPRSGASLSVTFQRPLSARLIKSEDGLTVYACNGTPVDCVKLALACLCPRRPDVVLGGINHGDNSAVNVHYSGTMGIVIEACLKGIPAIGFSYQSHSMDLPFARMRTYIDKVLQYVLHDGLPSGVCLNVNVPDTPHLRGLRLCRMGRGVWQNELVRQEHPRGGHYYWLVGEFNGTAPCTTDDGNNHHPDLDGDYHSLSQGYVTVVPVQIDVTAWQAIEPLKTLCDTI